jgi:hypothetical protein
MSYITYHVCDRCKTTIKKPDPIDLCQPCKDAFAMFMELYPSFEQSLKATNKQPDNATGESSEIEY